MGVQKRHSLVETNSMEIYVREHRRANQKWTIQRYWQQWVRKMTNTNVLDTTMDKKYDKV